MISLFKNLFDSNEKAIKRVTPLVEQTRDFEKKLSGKEIPELRKITEKMTKEVKEFVEKVDEKNKLSLKIEDKGQPLKPEEKAIQDKLLAISPEFFAIINEIYKKKIGISYFDVQFTAGFILSQGQKLTELKTGEGKTMVFQLPAFLYALTGRGSHLITVNDYLAKVGAEYAGHIASELGLEVGVITSEASYKFIKDEEIEKFKGKDVYKECKKYKKESNGISISNMRGYNLIECDKRDAYQCDVVYGTNNEFGFDYLRDNMARGLKDIKQGELYFVIIDEADSILIDEARTPLIISAPADISNELYKKFAINVRRLKKEQDYTVDEKAHSSVLTEEGIVKMEKALGVKNIWEDYQYAHHLDNALKALALYKKDVDYLIRDGEIMIVDQFTGRVLPGRRYSEGLHQAIEAKEGVEIKKESKTLATITFQNFFRLYKIISGGSGTILTEAEEFYKIYHLDSVVIPTNMPVVRKDQNDRVYKNREIKFKAVAQEIVKAHKTGRPILVGTTSIDDSEYLSDIVDKMGIEHEVLNAKHHAREAHIVSKAGYKHAVTIATNMAGRGTDIPLKDGVQALGGLYVIGTQRHESRRIDNQLRGRSGRQGDPGETRFFVSLDDDIMRIQGGHIVQKIMEMTNIPDDMPIEAGMIGRSLENAQKKMENMHFDSRKRVVEYDDVINQQREIFYIRRRRYITIADNSYGIFRKNNNIIEKKDDDPNVTQARKELENELLNILLTETAHIVSTHFIKNRDDKQDVKKLVEEFIGLAPDTLIIQTINNTEKTINLKSTEDLINFLNKELQKKSENSIQEYLEEIVRQMHTLKKEQMKRDYYEVFKVLTLESMDSLWTQHLETMQDLREGIGLRGYAQRDPLVEYKNEGFHQFDMLIENIEKDTANRFLKVAKVNRMSVQNPNEIKTNTDQIDDMLTGDREMLNSIQNVLQKQTEKTADKKDQQSTTFKKSPKTNIGRNDPCWCGSGKKYKKCHGKNV